MSLRLSVPLSRAVQRAILPRAVPLRMAVAARSASPLPQVGRGLRTSCVSRAEPVGVEVEASPAPEAEGEQTEGEKQIMSVLQAKFNPSMLSVTDVSGGCGAFYTIIVASKQFNGLSTLKQHRLVQSELKNIIKDIHGLQLHTVPEPDEP